jgi:hypothetical protein
LFFQSLLLVSTNLSAYNLNLKSNLPHVARYLLTLAVGLFRQLARFLRPAIFAGSDWLGRITLPL